VLRHPDSYRDKSGFGAEAPTKQKILNALWVNENKELAKNNQITALNI